jgi:F0F1-type ATP synthase membrane subunit b/b'
MDPDSNFIFERCKEVAKLSQEILEKIKGKGVDKDQDIEYLEQLILII